MTPKNRVDKLGRLLRQRIPHVVFSVDAPTRPKGDWFIDIKVGTCTFVIEHRPAVGFGLSATPSDGIGEGPDEVFDTDHEVVEALARLLRVKARRVGLLQELREQRQMSQVAVAAKLKVRQPTISKIERREDMSLSTLRRYVRALGGNLQVTAQFPDGAVEIGGDVKPRKPARSTR